MINRREALMRMGGILGLSAIAPAKLFANSTATAGNDLKLETGKPFSIGHITDIHLIDKYDAEKWFAKALHELQNHPSKPAFIVNTGDSIMDTTKTDRQVADRQWNVWKNSLKNDLSIPIYSCLGNHDIWGAHHKIDSPTRKDPMYGKKLGLDGLGQEKLYYSFDQGGWHIVMLDSIMTSKDIPWQGMLDDEQFEWLKADLKATPADRPVMVCSHMPIIQVCAMETMKPDDHQSYNWSNKLMMGDARRIIDLFAQHKNVKLCFSGHIHRVDRVELSGVTYICDGAICGPKWRGSAEHSVPGYSVSTLYPDGKFDYEYKTFGWKDAKA